MQIKKSFFDTDVFDIIHFWRVHEFLQRKRMRVAVMNPVSLLESIINLDVEVLLVVSQAIDNLHLTHSSFIDGKRTQVKE